MMNFVEDFLEYLGLRPERAHTPTLPPGMALEQVELAATIASIFDPTRQRRKANPITFLASPGRPDQTGRGSWPLPV